MSLHVKSLSGGYGKRTICRDISFEMQAKEVVCIVGPNGSGKTTLIKLILGLLHKTEGDIQLNKESINTFNTTEMAKHFAYVPQQHTVQFSLTVFEMVLMGRTNYIQGFSQPKVEDEKQAYDALKELHISHLKNQFYNTLSSGQKQMVLIARALCQKANILVMDEPTSNLDYYNQSLVIHTIQQLSKKGYSILITSHNLSQPFLYAHKTLILKKGTAFAFGNIKDVITNSNLTNAYELEMEVVSTKDSKGKERFFCVPV